MKSIMPNLWFDKNAEEAVKFYTALFKNSKIGNFQRYGKEGFEFHQMPEGTLMTVEFELFGQKFLALNGGPIFKFSEAVSFFIYCESETEILNFYNSLSNDGKVIMKLDKYDWSEKYAWVIDKFGISWQLDITKSDSPQKIVPTLLFVNDKITKVKEAVDHYTNIFPESKIIFKFENPANDKIKEETIMFAQFALNGVFFNAMSGEGKHEFDFNESISFIVNCDSQEEIDFFWEKLGKEGDPKAQQCGWLKDKFGVSWQIVPSKLGKLLNSGNKEQSSTVMNELLKMKKLDLEVLEKAYSSKS